MVKTGCHTNGGALSRLIIPDDDDDKVVVQLVNTANFLLYFADPNNTQIRERINSLRSKMRSSIANAEKESSRGYVQERVYKMFAKLCKGSKNKEEKKFERQLRCWYNNKHPALLLKPASMEWLNYEPAIVIFHDFTSDKENDELIKLATPWVSNEVSVVLICFIL